MNYRKRKLFTLIGLLALFAGILFSSFHYHEKGEIPDNCTACRFQNHGVTATSADITAPIEPGATISFELINTPGDTITVSTRPHETLPNAPPSFS